MNAVETADRRAALRAFGIGLALCLGFAAPSLLRLVKGVLAPSEAKLGEAMVSAFGGIALPIVAAAVVGSMFGNGTAMRTRLDRKVAAGLDPARAAWQPFLLAMLAGTLSAALVGAFVIVGLRLGLRIGDGATIAFDMATTAWALTLGAATWTALALAFVVRTGRAARGWGVIGIDLVGRLLPGGALWITPSAHVGNLLGAPPPRGFVHVPVLPQVASVVVLAVYALGIAFFASRRYRGAAPVR